MRYEVKAEIEYAPEADLWRYKIIRIKNGRERKPLHTSPYYEEKIECIGYANRRLKLYEGKEHGYDMQRYASR